MVAERRRSPRTNREATGWLSQPFGKRTGGRPIRVYDLSLHGVGFLSEIEHELNREHWIVVSDNALRLSTRCRIVSCRKNDLGTYQCGAEFF